MKTYCLLIFISFFVNIYGQEKFKIKVEEGPNWKSMYYIINEKGEIIKQLDSTKYIISFNGDNYESFAVFGIKGERGWSAIDINEKKLFEVYNTSFGNLLLTKLLRIKYELLMRIIK